ncbi:MAG: AcrB/AcrD/AcrF family protein [Chlorobi bacterium]|nr:AcrB/AcrD/AcrF family protein [Chlorobiota bacterium]
MEQKDKSKSVIREFFLTSFSLKNKNTIYLMTVILVLFGFFSYRSMPKELFPEVFFPTVMVNTIYPGNPPVDIENLITRQLEKEIETVKGVKKISSTSSQDVSAIIVEFNTNVDIDKAVDDVKDAVDKAKSDLPNDLDNDPTVQDIDFSEFPIININLSGDFSLVELKRYADYLQEEIEKVTEVSKVNITGINEREILINVDPYKMDAMAISFNNIENAITSENVSISGGDLKANKTRRSIRIIGEFTDVGQIRDIIVKHEKGNIVYLRDIAEVVDGYADPDNYARLDKLPVVSLQVVKKSGENLLSATDKIFEILDVARETKAIPENLSYTLTNDQSDQVRKQLANLENSMIMGIIFVVVVLFFFLGTRNAILVGMAIPMSMFLSFVVLNLLGYRINMIILFALILALGMLVDNAIVVIENIHRYIDRGVDIKTAASQATGEIAMPIISSTATTLAAFLPLAFWHSMMGEFMKYMPITLIIVLTSSLFVALVIIPVFATDFLKKDAHKETVNRRRSYIIAGVMVLFAILFYILEINVLGSLLIIFALIGISNVLFLNSLGKWFQEIFLKKLENWYEAFIRFALKGYNPHLFVLGAFVLLWLTLVFLKIRQPGISFMPHNDPKYINIIAELPIGTDIQATDSLMKIMEEDVFRVLEPNKKIVTSVMTTVGSAAKGENEKFSVSENPNKGLITVNFEDYEFRNGIGTDLIMRDLSNELIGKYPGVQVSVEKNRMGPPTGKAINLEISGKEFNQLLYLTDTIQHVIDHAHIPGIEGLKIDLDVGMPQLIIHIDRDQARRLGISTAQIAMTIRTSLFGKEISDFKVGEDKYPIQLRFKDKYRYNIASLMNKRITFRSQSSGKIIQIPISSVASFTYSTTYGAVKRKDMDRVITIYSNVIEGYNATQINDALKPILADFPFPEGYAYQFTGEQEEQKESMEFLTNALLIAMSLIMLILVSQFNSVIKPLIIMTSVLLSTIGVFGGIATFNMDFIVILTGIGIVSLAGVVVNNAIVLIDYINLTKLRKKKELGMDEHDDLSVKDSLECIVLAGKTRLRPVLLTAITTILGLMPMAVGFNIDFESALAEFKPHIYFGGDMANFWGPFAWTVVFGLSFATFLTLIIVPALYHILYIAKLRMFKRKKVKKVVVS